MRHPDVLSYSVWFIIDWRVLLAGGCSRLPRVPNVLPEWRLLPLPLVVCRFSRFPDDLWKAVHISRREPAAVACTYSSDAAPCNE